MNDSGRHVAAGMILRIFEHLLAGWEHFRALVVLRLSRRSVQADILRVNDSKSSYCNTINSYNLSYAGRLHVQEPQRFASSGPV
jgi:hypothetical protein